MNKVTEKALAQRINRKLAHTEERLCKSRSEQDARSVGWYFVINRRFNSPTLTHVDLESLGRDLHVLRTGEEVQA
jgi:hypothetical protein